MAEHEHDHDHAHDHPHRLEREPFGPSMAPRRVDGLVELEAEGELLVLDPRANRLHHLDRVGTIIWSVLDGEATTAELVDDLADAFSVDAGVVRADLDVLLGDLDRVFLLEADGREPIAVGTHRAPSAEPDDGVWRPTYLVDPPAP